MSYQGQAWAWTVRGLNRGERAVLDFIAWRQDQRTNVAKASLSEIAEHCEMGERQVTRILQQLAEKHIVKRILGGDGRGRIPLYALMGFKIKKSDIFVAEKGDISGVSIPERMTFPAEKGDISGTLIRKEGTPQVKAIQELQNITPGGALTEISPNAAALKTWLKVKDDLRRQRPEWETWLRPMYFVRVHGENNTSLALALPPTRAICEAYNAAKRDFNQELFQRTGFEHTIMRYPSASEARLLADHSPEWSEVHERLMRGEDRSVEREAAARKKPVQAAG